jgi:hypothetical protein
MQSTHDMLPMDPGRPSRVYIRHPVWPETVKFLRRTKTSLFPITLEQYHIMFMYSSRSQTICTRSNLLPLDMS